MIADSGSHRGSSGSCLLKLVWTATESSLMLRHAPMDFDGRPLLWCPSNTLSPREGDLLSTGISPHMETQSPDPLHQGEHLIERASQA